MVKEQMGGKDGIAIGVGIGLIAAIFTSVVASMALAWLIGIERVGEGAVALGTMLIQMMATAIGCTVAWGCTRRQRMLVTGLTAGGYFLTLVLGGLAFGGIEGGVWRAVLMLTIGGVITLIPLFYTGKGGANRRKIRTFR